MILLLLIIYLTFISLGLPDSIFGVVWPVMHLDLNVDESLASIYVIIVGLCGSLSSCFSGFLIKKFGTALLTFVSVIFTAIGLIGIRFSVSFIMVLAFAIPLGMGAGAVDAALNYYVAEHYKARHMNWLHCFWGVGVTISPLIASPYLAMGDWRGGFEILAILQFSIAFVILLAVPKWLKKEKQYLKLKPLINKSEETTVNAFKIKGIWAALACFGFYCAMEFMIGTWGASYIVNVMEVDASIVANIVSLFYAGIMLGRLLSGFLSIKMSDKKLIWLGTAISIGGLIVFILPVMWTLYVGLFLIGLGFGPIFPCSLHATSYRFGAAAKSVVGYQMAFGYGIGFAIQLSFGYLTPYIGFKSLPYILLGLAILMVLSILRINKVVAQRKINFLD